MSKSLSWSLEAERHECWHARDVWQISSNHWWIQCFLAGNNVASWHLSCSVSVNPFASTAAGGKILFGGNIGMWTIEVFLESVLPKLLSIEEDTHCPSSRMVINIMFFFAVEIRWILLCTRVIACFLFFFFLFFPSFIYLLTLLRLSCTVFGPQEISSDKDSGDDRNASAEEASNMNRK